MASKNDNDEASVASADSENSYLALRAAKIARNQARLRELGLLNDPPPAAANKTTNSAPKLRQQRKDMSVTLQPIRRSTRASRGKTSEPYITESTEKRRLDKGAKSKIARSRSASTSTASANPVSLLPSSSARQIHLDINELLFGDNGMLGQPLAMTGKAAVMDTSANLASDPRQLQTVVQVSFNKYSGVQEWANCFFLWVNFGALNNQVVNEFYDDGKQVIWFGGSSMHSETPVVQRLQHPLNKGRVILWCREYSSATKTFGPYVCLGRLELLRYNSQTQPLEFVWKLLDFERLAEQSKAGDRMAGRMMARYCGNSAFL
ncbi:hypothetical protein MPSEU_000487900 [Mayamaea pseudoterrestris]|nr:hypothetical protein MPSEU_000487900 [Mayamaea pseudoterrestris]